MNEWSLAGKMESARTGHAASVVDPNNFKQYCIAVGIKIESSSTILLLLLLLQSLDLIE